MLLGGRWNSPGRPVIYGALSFAGAMLEILVHARIGKVPKTHVAVVAEVPQAVAVEILKPEQLPADWDHVTGTVARTVGDRWLSEVRSAVLVIPSVVARGEFNAIVNPRHPDAGKILVSDPIPVLWDERLFPIT